MGDLLGADPGGIVFGRSMTQLTFDFARTLAQDWRPGDDVVVSRLDHDANVRPWVRYAEKSGATLRWIDFDPDSGHLDVSDVEAVLTDRTKVVAITGASNILGSRPDLPAISKSVHAAGALLYVDGVHLTPHAVVDVTALGADFYGCSPYKFFGPHIGVMAAAPALLETLHPDKLLPSTEEVPERFELGTLPYELLTGDLSQVNYSSIRAGLVEFRRLIDAVQWQIIIPMLCQPSWDWFTEQAWAAGKLPQPRIPVEWSPPRFEAVDPLKDAMADLLAMRSGTMTLAQAIARQGHNPDAVLAEIAAMNAKLDALGLVLDSDPRRVTKTGVMQADPALTST